MKLKRIVAALLTLVLLLGMMPTALAAHKHKFKYRVVEEPTCTKKGLRVFWCTSSEPGCNQPDGEETIPALGHSYRWNTTKEATCTQEGKEKGTCRRCGATKTRSTDKAAHRYGEWTVIAEPTDLEVGIRERTCRVCGYANRQEFYPEGTLKRGGKNDSESVKILQEALNNAGYNVGTPDGSFGRKTEDAIKQLQEDNGMEPDGIAWPGVRQLVEHAYGEWYIKVEATLFTKGLRERACQKCGYIQQEEFYPDGTLLRGDRNNEAVRAMQAGLKEAGCYYGYADGDFGRATERAVKNFQSANGMEPDGIGWPGLQDMLGSGKAALEAEILIEIADVVAPVVDRLPEYTANVATEGFSFKELRWLYNGAALADGERFKLDETYTVEVQAEGDAVDAARLKASINGEAASVRVDGGVITLSCDMVCALPAGGMLSTMDLKGKMPASVAVTIQQPRVGFYPDRHASIVVTRVDGTTFTAGQYGGNAAEWYSQNGVNFNQPFRSTEEQYKFVNQIPIPYAADLTATVNGVSAQVESYSGGSAIQVSAWLDCLPGENVTLSVTDLDEPKAGVQPDTTVSLASEPECEVKNIRWYEINRMGAESLFYSDGAASSAFKPGCSYRVEIEVASKDGRIYPAFDHISATINGQTADKIGVRNDLIKLSYTFPKIEHAPFEISGFDVPAAGVPLDYEGTVQGPVEATIKSVEWRKMLEKACAPGDKAEWGGYYRLTLGIETKQPIPSDPKASINSITDGVKVKVTDGYHMEVWYEFPAVGGAYVVDVTGVTKPAIDEAADADCAIATPGFKLAKLNGMYWEVNGERAVSGYVFQPGDVATVVINASLSTGTMMNPAEATKLSATVDGETATTVVNGGKLEIRFSYPPAELAKVSEIGILFDNYEIGGTQDMEGKVIKATAEDGASVALAMSGISWYDVSTGEYIGIDNLFEPSHQYRVSGSLKAPEDYQFSKADTKVTVNHREASFDLGSFDSSAMRFTCIFAPLTTKDEIKTITRIVATMPKPTRDNCPGRDQLSLTVYCEDGTTGACVLDKYHCYDGGFVDGVLTGMDDGYIDLEMSIKPSDGYLIDEYAIATVNGMAANVNVNGGGTGAEIKHAFYVPYQGENCKISSINVLVNEPYPDDVIDYHPNATGMCLPVENLGTRPAGITIESVKWQDLTSLSVLGNTDQAVGGHDYRFTLKVSADQGYEFIPSPQVTVNGKTVNCIADGTELMLQADFYCTPIPSKAIKTVDVRTPALVAGNKVPFSPNLLVTTQNNAVSTGAVKLNRVSWLDYSAGRVRLEGDVFEAGHVYELTVSVSAADGYSFTDGVKGLVNNLDPDSVVLASGILTIKKNFTCKEAAGDQDSSNDINGNFTYTDTDIVYTPLDPDGSDDNIYVDVIVTPVTPDGTDGEAEDPDQPEDTDPIQPDYPDQPLQPIETVKPEPPADSVTPVEPVTPAEPVIPVEPELPGKLEIGNLAVSKRVSSSPANGSYYVPGETVSFEVSVVNTGEVKLEGIAVSDHMMAENGGVQSYASMDPGTAEFFSFGYTVSEMDAAAGSITNVATAQGFAEDGTRYAAVSNAVTVPTGMKDWPMGVITELSIVKEETSSPANGSYYTEGETISYLITYTNTGETRLGETIVYDTLAGEIASAEGLDSGEDRICYFSHTVTASDVARGYVANAAIAQYDMGAGYMGSATSNTVISDTDGDPATVPGEFGSIDWELLQAEQPDACLRKLISHDGEGTAYEIDFCTGHQATHKAIQTMLKAAGDDVNRQRMAWERAYGLWQKELDVMYEKLLDAADDVAKITIMSERVRYLTMVANTQFALQIANPEKGAENARVIANLWRDKCVDLCCEISTAPAGRADSFLSVPRGEPADELGETCICTVTAEDTEKSAWTDGFCFTHGFTYEMMQALLESETGAETWETIYSLWDYELNTAYNAVYGKASGEGGIAYLTEYAAYTTWLPARLDELKLFYPEGEIAAEVMADTIMARALAICARLPQA